MAEYTDVIGASGVIHAYDEIPVPELAPSDPHTKPAENGLLKPPAMGSGKKFDPNGWFLRKTSTTNEVMFYID